jgi:hypothetical protein
MLEGMAQPVGEFVHPGVGKATVPFDINHGGIVGKPQSSLLKYPTHVHEHINNSILLVIENLFHQIRDDSPAKISNCKHQISNKFKIQNFNDQNEVLRFAIAGTYSSKPIQHNCSLDSAETFDPELTAEGLVAGNLSS